MYFYSFRYEKRLEINGTLSLDFQPGAFLSARTDAV